MHTFKKTNTYFAKTKIVFVYLKYGETWGLSVGERVLNSIIKKGYTQYIYLFVK